MCKPSTEKCHMCNNLLFTLRTDMNFEYQCGLCNQFFTGFRYEFGPYVTIDVRCASISDSLDHESHPHRLYYSTLNYRRCSRCEDKTHHIFSCDECDEYKLDGKCAMLPNKAPMKKLKDPRNGSLYWYGLDMNSGWITEWIEGSHEGCGRPPIFPTPNGA
ncbi:hypothetical protein DY000_02020319 [Brassica cretica]|uniref:DC1 domain-containing protein n=1 Tax=Brassica cretica TaxID=69181 RepID=A0ABQ7E2T3_BRACR|nr:hypothetical protein DY000_02020319 [Brassica cretica]